MLFSVFISGSVATAVSSALLWRAIVALAPGARPVHGDSDDSHHDRDE
ncbi:MAG TPA: hypothetical protein PLA27_08800 [Anaerolineales bacterium]|nr:hypothetical protein [Anaerolineales bacterium]